MIKIIPISHQQAYVLARNWNNVSWATKRNPYFVLPPFTFDGILPATYTVSTFSVRPLTFKGKYKTVGTPESLSTGLIQWERGDNSDTFYYLSRAKLTLSIETGLHEMYIKLSNNAEYISEPFYYVDCGGGIPGTAGDYANASPDDDYSNDNYRNE